MGKTYDLFKVKSGKKTKEDHIHKKKEDSHYQNRDYYKCG